MDRMLNGWRELDRERNPLLCRHAPLLAPSPHKTFQARWFLTPVSKQPQRPSVYGTMRTISLVVVMMPLFGECADAGVCQLSKAPSAHAERWRADVHLDVASGGDGIDYVTLSPRLSFTLWTSTVVSAVLPYLDLDGPDGDANGIGDSMVTLRQEWAASDTLMVSLIAGVRLPTGDDNANPGLPQGYQLGLGSIDVLGGIGGQWRSLSVTFAYQAAGDPNDLEGTHLQRGDDVALSGDVAPRLGHWQPQIGLVAVHRLDESTIDAGSGRTPVVNSDGMQVNLRGGVTWTPRQQVDLGFSFAKALLSRESNVDGLTRSWAIGLSAASSW